MNKLSNNLTQLLNDHTTIESMMQNKKVQANVFIFQLPQLKKKDQKRKEQAKIEGNEQAQNRVIVFLKLIITKFLFIYVDLKLNISTYIQED